MCYQPLNVLFKLLPWDCCLHDLVLQHLGLLAAFAAPDRVDISVSDELGGDYGYYTISSMLPGLAPSMSTVLGLKFKII